MAVTARGFSELKASLRNVAEKASRGVRESLEQGAEDIKDLAVLYAPVDKEFLEKSIKVMSDIESNRRKAFFVYVDEELPADGNTKVGDYATIMHERYNDFEPGKKTKDKRRDNPGVNIGEKYLERALEDLKDEVENAAQARARQGIGH